MDESSERLEARRKHLERLLDLNVAEYQSAAVERRQLFQEELSVVDNPVCMELEIFWSDVTGYASQIVNKGFVSTPKETLDRLHRGSIFDKEKVQAWYFSEENSYPILKSHARTLDYLRLLVIEYITFQQP